jgi:hypothetical protein
MTVYQQRPKHLATQLKKLLSLCTDVQLTFRLANDLGLTDVVKDLERSDCGHYLKDIVALKTI